MVDNTSYNRPGETTPHTTPVDPAARQNDHVRETTRETTIVTSGNSNGMIAGVVLVVLLAIAGYFFLTGGDDVADSTAPAIENNINTAPAADQASPAAPAPEAPEVLAPSSGTETVPVDPNSAAPATPAPTAPATDG
ncbi:hypothetical protein [Hoeflea sp.]|uniref:hypothetical protein n=1 Tax=Hoeflea sp. TaxID=1940281 RepID=UPI0019CEAD9F|nr:hypothetical protein [Hoeflea sp.]MBC7280843.1 hypothetical protein [Hoeflea sp.]